MIFKPKSLIIAKGFISFLLAFFCSQLIITYVVSPNQPVVRESFKAAVQQTNENVIDSIRQGSSAIVSLPSRIGNAFKNPSAPIAFIPPPLLNSFTPPLTPQSGSSLPPSSPLPTQDLGSSPFPTSVLHPTQGPGTFPQPTSQPLPATQSPAPTNQPIPSPTQAHPDNPPTAEISELVSLVNNERARQQPPVASLRFDARLAAAAQNHAQDMHDQHYFSHFGPDGRSPWDFANAASYHWAIAEVIAAGQGSAQAAFSAWMNSPPHRGVLMDSTAKAVAFGKISNSCGSSLQFNPCWVGLTGGL